MTCEAWPVEYGEGNQPDDADDAVVAAALLMAQETLFALSGHRFGDCTVTEVYEARGGGTCMPTPFMGDDREWRNERGTGLEFLHLSRHPVRSVSDVWVGGVQQAPSTYRLSRNRLAKLPRGSVWSSGVDIEVTYRYGAVLDAGAALAMGALTLEFVAAILGKECRLPSKVTSVVRQGVSQTFETWETLFAQGRTGITVADHWLRAVNPTRIIERTRVYSPDMATRL